MRRNIILYYLYKTFYNFVALYAVWYAFELRYASVFTLSLIYAVNRFLILVLELPTGALADLFGRKNTLSLGYLIEGAGWCLIGIHPSLITLWIGYLLSALGSSLISGSDSALLYDSLKTLKQESQFVKISANANLLMRFSIFAGIIIGGYVFSWWSGLTYILFGGAQIIAASIAVFSKEPAIDSEKFTLSNYLKQIQVGAQQLLGSSTSKFFSVFYVTNGGITWYFIYFLYTAWFSQLIASDIRRSWLMASISIGSGVVLFLVPKLLRSITAKNMTLLFGVLTTTALLLASARLGSAFWMAGMLYTLAIARFSFLDQVANEFFDSKYRATALSTLNMGVSLVFIVLSICGGWIMQHATIQHMFLLLGLVSLGLSAPIIWRFHQAKNE